MKVLVVSGKEHPFELTARGRLNLEENKVDLTRVPASELHALRFAFEMVKGACKSNETPFKFDFNAFVDKVEPTVVDKARALCTEYLASLKLQKEVPKDKTK